MADCLPEMLFKVSVLTGRSMGKSKKRRAIAQAALGDCGDLAQLWPSSWPLALVERRVWAALLGKDPLNPLSVPKCMFWSNTLALFAVCVCVFLRTFQYNVFDFVLDLHATTPTFESVFGKLPARNALKSMCFS